MADLSDLKPDRRNANKGTPRGRALLEDSLRRYGAGRSILADKHGNVIAGNKTLEAAADLGLPVRFVETDGTELVVVQRRDLDLDTEQARSLAYADNRVAELDLDWDVARLLEDRDDGLDLSAVGFSDAELAELLAGVDTGTEGLTDPDAVPPVPEVPITKPGDLWLLGRHRLLCGDSQIPEHVDRLVVNEPAAIVTDPPYGINLDTAYSSMPKTTRDFDPIIGDDEPFDASFLRAHFAGVGEQFWFGADYYARSLGDTEHSGAWLVWDKRTEENYDRGFGSAFEMVWSARQRKRAILRHLWFQNHAADPQEAGNRQHPTQKPIALLAELIEMATSRGDIVLDPFLGSGTTLIAAEQLGRTCYGMEISPAYCDVIVTRWQEFTGSKAVRQ